MAEVRLPDGNVANIPDFAMEKTQNDMKQLLSAMVGADEKSLKIYENIFKNAKADAKQSADDAKALQDIQKDSNKALNEVAEAAKKGKIFTSDNLLKTVNGLDSWLTKSFLAIGGSALTGAGVLAAGIKGLGDELLDLQKVGVGFSDASGTAEGLIANLQFLGLSAGQASGLMSQYAGVVQTMGKTGFADIQKTFNNLSDNGNRFGLSLAESAEVLAEDLELRRTLGMLGNIDANRQAQRSAELYEMQMSAAQALGKSVEEIRKETDSFIDSNFQAQLALAQLGETAGPAALHAMQALGTSLAGVAEGGLGDDILTAMAEPVFGASESSKTLFRALSASGEAGQKLAADIQALNDLKNTDPDAYAEQVKKMGPKIKSALAEIRMDPKAAENMAALAARGDSAAGAMENIFRSGSKAVSANEAAIKTAGSFQSGLARGSQAFDAALNTVTGSMGGMMTDFTAAFAAPMGEFADAITKDTLLRNENGEILDKNGKVMQREIEYTDQLTGEKKKELIAITDYNQLSEEQKKNTQGTIGIMSAFKDAVSVIRAEILESFGKVGDETGGFAETLRSKVVPAIQGFADWFKGGGWDSIKNGFVLVGGILSGFGEALGFVKYLVTDKLIPAIQYLADMFGFGGDKVDEDGKKAPTDFAKLGKTIGLSIVGLLALTKAFKIASAAVSFGSKITGMIGGGGVATAAGGAGNAGSAVAKGGAGFTKTIANAGTSIGSAIKSLGQGIGSAIQGLAEGIGKGVAAVGKGIGTALGGILKGLASGLAAFANPAILLGAGILGGAITLIGAGIAGAAWIMGSALPTFAEGLDSFANIDGDNLVNVAKGIGAIGLAMAAMGAGGAAGSIGTAVSGVVDGIAGFFGADDPLDKINEFAAYDFDVAKVLQNAGAVQAFGEAMIALGAGAGLGNLGAVIDNLSGASPMDLLKKFSEEKIDLAGLDHNILAMDKLATLFEKFANLNTVASKTAEVSGFSASSGDMSDTVLDPPAKPNAYQQKVNGMNSNQTLNQPSVMAINKDNSVYTGTPLSQTANTNQGTSTSRPPLSSSADNAGTDSDVLTRMEAHLSAIAGHTGKSTKQLRKLDRTIQEDF